MNNLFYLERKQNTGDFEEDLGFNFMDSVEIIHPGPNEKRENINFYEFLHGYCDVFAYRLREKFGYDICFDYEDEDCSQLIHAYCTVTVGNKTYWIDCRGITDDYEEFIEEFADWDCFGNMDSSIPWFIDQSKIILNRNGIYKKEHKIIDKIFVCYEHKYNAWEFATKERKLRYG